MKTVEETDYRLERKFFLSGVSLRIIQNYVRLHEARFSPIYEARWINNIYFDTYNFENYFNSFEGIARRVKVRIRWYGDLEGKIEKPILELKIKINTHVKKLLFPLPSFHLDRKVNTLDIERLLRKSKIPEVFKIHILSQKPVLLNRYNRRYFQSFDKAFRLTLDKEIKVYKILGRTNNLLFRRFDVTSAILELKYKPVYDDMARTITNSFPFRMTKSSKYIDGMVKLYE